VPRVRSLPSRAALGTEAAVGCCRVVSHSVEYASMWSSERAHAGRRLVWHTLDSAPTRFHNDHVAISHHFVTRCGLTSTVLASLLGCPQRAANRRPASLFGYVKALLPTVFGGDDSEDDSDDAEPQQSQMGDARVAPSNAGASSRRDVVNGNGAHVRHSAASRVRLRAEPSAQEISLSVRVSHVQVTHRPCAHSLTRARSHSRARSLTPPTG
jgi:hypothetical protein